jgi:predicted DNA-binding transcriptional regulator YafY
MSKKGYFSRYNVIIKTLKKKPYSSYEELRQKVIEYEELMSSGMGDLNLDISQRTLQRDIKDIREMMGVDIRYSKKQGEKGYYISQSQYRDISFQQMMESFDLLNTLQMSRDNEQYIYFDNKKPKGTEHMMGLLHAIKNKKRVCFDYEKFWDENEENRCVDPYALKEYDGRWYVLAKDRKDAFVKTFGLDRMQNLDITNEAIETPIDFDIEEYFRYSFGIVSSLGQKPQEIILSFDPFQGKYIKSLPLHDSQEILIDNDKELRIRMKLFITIELVMKILSFGENVKVLKPKELVKKIQSKLKSTLGLYH